MKAIIEIKDVGLGAYPTAVLYAARLEMPPAKVSLLDDTDLVVGVNYCLPKLRPETDIGALLAPDQPADGESLWWSYTGRVLESRWEVPDTRLALRVAVAKYLEWLGWTAPMDDEDMARLCHKLRYTAERMLRFLRSWNCHQLEGVTQKDYWLTRR